MHSLPCLDLMGTKKASYNEIMMKLAMMMTIAVVNENHDDDDDDNCYEEKENSGIDANQDHDDAGDDYTHAPLKRSRKPSLVLFLPHYLPSTVSGGRHH